MPDYPSGTSKTTILADCLATKLPSSWEGLGSVECCTNLAADNLLNLFIWGSWCGGQVRIAVADTFGMREVKADRAPSRTGQGSILEGTTVWWHSSLWKKYRVSQTGRVTSSIICADL